jgi:hypothetical protein
MKASPALRRDSGQADLFVSDGIDVFESEVLKFPANFAHA